jgi:hypothetical protein
MRSVLPWGLLLIGVVLLVPFVAACLRKPVNEVLAQQPLRTIPLDTLTPGVHTIYVKIPDSAEWKHIRRQWGEPGYIVAVSSSSKSKYLRCMNPQRLSVSLQGSSGRPLKTQAPEGAPYGYSAECSSPGIRFEASSGSVVTLQVYRSAELGDTGDYLIVAPFWNSGIKDHIVGSLLDQDLAPVFDISAVIGALMLVASLLLFRGGFKRRRTA